MRRIVWDCETKNSPTKVGWQNFQSMGVQMCCIYDYELDEYRVYTDENKDEFLELYYHNWKVVLIGYNSKQFDKNLIDKCWRDPVQQTHASHFDIYHEICVANSNRFSKGKLDDVARLTIGENKLPIDFSNASFVHKLNYCLRDVWVTKRLFDYVLRHKGVVTPEGFCRFLRSEGLSIV